MNDFLFPYLGEQPHPEKLPYADRMRRWDWSHEIAPRIRRRARGFCERCRTSGYKLEVHHLTYERFGREWDEDLQALCHPCHVIADKERRQANRSKYGTGDFGEEAWCISVFGEDPCDWPDDASERFWKCVMK
jgi:hypothetical protein